MPPYPFGNYEKAKSIQYYYRYMPDSSNKLNAEQALKLFNSGYGKRYNLNSTFNVGKQPYIYWFYLPISNKNFQSADAILRLNTSISKLVCYEIQHDSIIKIFEGSSYLPYRKRPFRHRDLAIPIHLKPNDTIGVLFSVDKRNRGLYMPIYLDSMERTLRSEIDRHWVYGIYIGIFLFILLFNLFLFFSLKDKIHLWYSGYVFSEIFFIFQDERLYVEFFPDSSQRFFENAGTFPCTALLLGFSLKIMQLFLNQKKENSKLYYPVTIVLNLNFITAGLIFLCSFASPVLVFNLILILNKVVDWLFIVSMTLLVVYSIHKTIQKQQLAKYYLIAIALPFFGSLIFYLNHLGIITFNPVKPNGLVVGITAEMILLSILLVVRYNNFKKEAERLLLEDNKLRKEQEVLLMKINRHQENMIQQIVDTQEHERNRIAQDLHDDLGGTLGTLRLQMSLIEEELGTENYNYIKSMKLIRRVTEDIKSIAYDLMPEEFLSIGLFKVLEQRTRDLNKNKVTIFSLITNGDDSLIKASDSLIIYRIASELISNVIKHAQASRADIQLLIVDNNIQMIVEDDGIGLDVVHQNKKGMGLHSITTRVSLLGGKLDIDSNKNGTTTIINIPLVFKKSYGTTEIKD